MNIQETRQSDGTIEVTLDEKGLTCLVCGNNRFHERKSLLNTRGGELFGVAWLDAKATNFICAKCGYIFWFMV
jgi:predicted nucleic-acid-binding Zn-ribbon protein